MGRCPEPHAAKYQSLLSERERLLDRRVAKRKEVERLENLIRQHQKQILQMTRALEANEVKMVQARPLRKNELRLLRGVRRAGQTFYAPRAGVGIRKLARAGYLRCTWGYYGAWCTLTESGEKKVKNG